MAFWGRRATRLSFVASLVLTFLSFLPAARASDYPPDYVIDAECKNVGPARVCALNRKHGSFPRLNVVYQGPLQAAYWGRISVFVTLNGRQGLFPLGNANYLDFVTIGGPRNVVRCVPAGSPSVGKPYPACTGAGSWNFVPPPQSELDLMFFARSDTGVANVWDVSLAFVSEDGTWDSASGENYSVRFGSDL